MLRLLRRWNQSGQKFTGHPDIALFLRSHPAFMVALILSVYALIYYELRTSLPGRAATYQSAMLLLATATFKLIFTVNDAPELFGSAAPIIKSISVRLPGLVLLSRLVFTLSGVYLLTIYPFRSTSATKADTLRQGLSALLTTFLSNQLRATNIAVLLLFEVIRISLYRLSRLSESGLSLWTLILAHASFFALGGTNGISSIDLSNAYNGISSYNPIPVGFLLFVSNWAGPIYWSVAGTITSLSLASSDNPTALTNNAWSRWQRHITRLTFFMAIAVFAVEAACCVLREHLFVWTVFSPKFLYVGAWVVGWHLGVNILLGGVITWIWQ